MEIQSTGNSRSSILSATDALLVCFFYKEMIACYPGVGEELVDLKIA